MTTINTIPTRRNSTVDLSVSRKQKLVLKPLKARKPGGRGQSSSLLEAVALTTRRRRYPGNQEMGTDQCFSTMGTSHRQSPSFTGH